ncbi:translational activator GCN1, putative [Phytophthora infestans T30-4]|uniref:Translational activator GCN1, putative n=1 Tax=Phytophthora infestans (strain T30-4) TaxID=403677 RepID=D0N464_PHYIT|nr:translational activator GCN1, putative [Phytophthora infestans T30-4]EEY69168.1 translational activator GCN1, putative [Phytophthora infestans T30-4]|eukprot:XP_002999022.1 translational activator GCN1, putative [Phytophthora infestans T30-4]
MAEQEDVLRSLLDTAVLRPSHLVFIQSYQHEVVTKCKAGELPLKRLASQVLAETYRCQYRSSERHLRALLSEACKELPTFPEIFSHVLRAKTSALVASFASARVIALRLSCVVLDAALSADTKADAAWLNELLSAQSRLLESTIGDKERSQKQARKALLKLLSKHGQTLLQSYVDMISAAEPEEQHYQLWLVLSLSDLLNKEAQTLLWNKYVFWAFESKKRTFAPLEKSDARFKNLSYKQFEEIIMPSMAKMLKKAPDTVIEAVGAFVHAAPLDFGRYLTDVFQSVLVSKLRAPKDDVRALAVALGGALAYSLRQSEYMKEFVTVMSALLDGKHGILAQFYQREVAFAVLKDAAEVATVQLAASEVQEIASIAIASLLKAVGKEAHEPTRHLGLLTLGKWLALAGTDEFEAATVTSLKTGLKNKPEPVVAGYLRTLAVLCRSRATAVAPFADEVVAVIKDSNKKPNVARLDGVLAVAVAGAIASASSELDARMAQEGVADLLLSSTSFVGNSVRALLSSEASTPRQATAPESPEVSALAALSRALVWVLASQQSDASEAYSLLVELLCSSSLTVRQSAEHAVETMYLSSLEHCAGLVAAFEKKIDALSAQEETSVPPASGLRRALRVLVPTAISKADDTKVQVFPFVLFLAHHPFLVAGRKAEAFSCEWQSIRRRFLSANAASADTEDDEDEPPSDASLVDNFIEEHEEVKTAVVELLANASTGKLYSMSLLQRLAAQRSLATLLDFAGNGEGEDLALHDIIEDLLAKRLDDEKIDALSEEDVAVCQTPFDELYEPNKEGEEEEATTRSKRGGRRGNEDEQWEQELREELERKKRAEQGAQKKVYTSEQKAQLEQQQQLRQKVRETHRVVSTVLEAVNMLAVARPDEVHPTLPYLLRSVRVLFTCPLFESEASSALMALTKAINPKSLRLNYQDVASALRVALELGQLTSDKAKAAHIAEVEGLFLRLLAEFMEYVFGFQFETETDFDADAPCNLIPPPTLHLLFPVLRDLLRFAPDLRRWALPLFAVHARMIPDEEEEEVGDVAAQRLLRRDMLQLTLLLLSQQATGNALPITNPDLAPGKLLTSLCLGPELTATEWAPLLGDDGLLSEEASARGEVLTALLNVVESEEGGEEFRSAKPSSLLISRLYCCRFDSEEENRTLANQIWDATGATVSALYAGPLLVLLNHTHTSVRESASLALADGMRQFPKSVTPLLNNLKTQFLNSQPKQMERKDEFGIPTVRRPGAQTAELDEDVRTMCPRLGVAVCLEKAAEVAGPEAMSSENTMALLTFVMEHGLGDPNSKVRAQMRKTGVQAVASLGGGANTAPLLEMFERFLETTAPPAAATAKSSGGKKAKIGTHLAAQEEDMLQQSKQALSIYDHQREGVVVCLGSLAKHMAPTDPKVSSIVDSLIEALEIPSESVQRSVAMCLSPLMRTVKDRSTSILDDLLKRATEGETFGERMGAAYGVSAVVKGLGISALKIHSIIPRLEESMKTGGANARQGAMLVFECLSQRLGLLFEPYIIVILPVMLKCSADASPQVREAASHTAKGIMANLSAHGVKLVLPSLLGALEESAWRTKQSGIQILGSMAYCAPRQLGSCLPQVVPKLMAALTDSHPKVREAGKSALRDVGSVVRNPEIATISKVLLDALEDPNRYTAEALQQLQSTSFQHSIDAPSLALVMPIITRGLKDRAGDAKKKAALIVGSMCSMINDAKDLVPYMETVLPSLKTQLVDPIPEVRAVAAKALGKLVKGLGERHFTDMLTWLLEAMKDDEVGPVERSGAAQGLCEVVVALGVERVERVMRDDILPLARHPKYSVREGVLWVMAFLPPALGKQFSMFLREALPIVVAGLSDEAESVRDVAMHSGHVVVNAHALSHTRDLLPSLEAGLFDDSWRIRQSSVMLLGDLMYRISGTRAVAVVSEDNDDDDDETSGSAAGDRAIIKLLGIQRRNAILASLYMIRSDTSAVVRQSALQVWKSVVANTPKTLRQILEALMNAIVSALSGDNMEKQTMAGRTLGEIVRKLGEHVLPEVVPILRAGLSPSLPTGRRQGACIGLAEVIDCCTKKQIEDYVDTLVDAVLDGVCDELAEVRASAAHAFNVLHKGIGYRAIDETVPMVLERIRSSPSAEEQVRALLGLQEILRVKSREVLPYLIPRLLVTPVTASAARAVSRVAQATGAVIHFQVEKIFATFFSQYEIKRSLRDVVLGVEAPGVHWLAIEICKYCESENALDRALAFELVAEFCSHATVPYDDQAPLFLKQIVLHLNDQTDAVVRAASAALKGMNVTIKPEQFAQHLDFIRQSINSMVSDARHRKGGVGDGEYLLPGLCIPKGLEPFLPSYQWALMNGSLELRQSAAAGLGELVELSSAPALRPYLIKLTGPLIRIAGDRFPGHVKAAILQTLEIILTKGGVALKPFLPQLQTTFVKALNDTALDVRAHGASALSLLVTLSPRVEPLLAELTERLRTTSGGVREANLEAVASVVDRVGDKLSAAGRSTLESALEEMLESSEDALRDGASKCLACCVASTANNGDLETAQKQLLDYSLANMSADDLQAQPWQRRQSAALFTALVLHKHSALLSADVTAPLTTMLVALAQDEQTAVRNHALTAIGAVVKRQEHVDNVTALVPVLVEGVAHKNKDVIRGALRVVKLAGKRSPEQTRQHLTALVPAVFQLIKSNNMAVKLPAERTLLYLLEVHSRPETQAEYLRSGSADAKIIGEYTRRVLSKLKADSGDESD